MAPPVSFTSWLPSLFHARPPHHAVLTALLQAHGRQQMETAEPLKLCTKINVLFGGSPRAFYRGTEKLAHVYIHAYMVSYTHLHTAEIDTYTSVRLEI